MHGLEVLKAYQEWSNASSNASSSNSTLVVGISAAATEQDCENAFKTGMHIFVSKPLKADSFRIILEGIRANQGFDITLKFLKDSMSTTNEVLFL